MNNVFNFKRFGKLFLHDLITIFKRNIYSFIGCALIIIILACIQLCFFNTPFYPDGRFTSICAIFLFYIFASPFILYKNVNNRKNGIDFIMLPASSLEKFISMILITGVIVPITIVSTLFLTDTAIAALFPNIFEGYAISIIKNISFPFNVLSGIIIYLFLIGILGNLLFRKHKIIATTACCIILFATLTYITYSTFGFVVSNIKVTDENGTSHRLYEYSEKMDDQILQYSVIVKNNNTNNNTYLLSLVNPNIKANEKPQKRYQINANNEISAKRNNCIYLLMLQEKEDDTNYDFNVVDSTNNKVEIDEDVNNETYLKGKLYLKHDVVKLIKTIINVLYLCVLPLIILFLAYRRLKRVQI